MGIYSLIILTFAMGEQPSPDDAKPSNVQQLCLKLRDAQKIVNEDAKKLNDLIQANIDKKPTAKDKEAAVKLQKQQNAIIDQTTDLIDFLKKEDTAVAFRKVVEEQREDMKRVQGRMEKLDFGTETQKQQTEILDMLSEMYSAITKKH